MMPDDAPLLHLDPDLHEQFVAEAEAAHQPVLQVMHDLTRGYVERQQAARVRDAWMRAEIEQALREADDLQVARVPNEDVEAGWHVQRAKLLERAGDLAG